MRERSHCNKKSVQGSEQQPLLPATREGPRAATKTQDNLMILKKKKNAAVLTKMSNLELVILSAAV